VTSSFHAGEALWVERLGNLRNVVRQELIRRQLARHVVAGMTVLDVGCGQGTQAIELTRAGCRVTGVEPSEELRALCAESATSSGLVIELLAGTIERLDEILSGGDFDLVCAHGVLMYMPSCREFVARLAPRVAERGLLSITFRNAHALGFRPGMRRDWAGALAAMDSDEYVNELGVPARADRIEAVERDLVEAGFNIESWYGVRVFNDAVDVEAQVPADEDLAALFDAEDVACRRDPFRWFASQLHVVARRSARPRASIEMEPPNIRSRSRRRSGS
jgi:S-adenosylmethionine-dependent methyltransferase